MERFMQRKQDFENAYQRLKEGINESDSNIAIDGILHRFEFTFELAWKTVKDYLEYQGIVSKVGSPREIIQEGFKQGIIKDGEIWIQMMLARNSLSHLYDEESSRQIYVKIKKEFINVFEDLLNEFKKVV